MPLPAVLRALCTIALLLPCAAAFAAPGAELITYPKDPNQYRSLRLANNMDVMLVHDAGATHAAANLTVQAGSAQNPADLPGLAHFTEHLVFLGSERYPDPNGYSSFIGKVGGSFNASTSLDFTTYYFRVPGTALEEAMQRLSATLAVPLFDVTYVDRERHAVDAEYRMYLDNDRARLGEVLGEILNPAHPIAKFSVGNLDTLSGDPQVLRQRVVDFYQRYYSANLMKLVVSGPQSLDELQAYVDNSFAAITDRKLTAPVIDQSLVRPGLLPAEVQVKPIQAKNEIVFMFPMRNAPSDLRNNTTRFLFKLLNDQGPGGLQESLKQAGLAREVSATLSNWRANEALITISVTLPPGTTPDFARIQASVFAYLEVIRNQGLQPWRYEETATLVRQNFSLKRPGDPLRHVNRITRYAWLYPVQDWLYGPFRMEHFDVARTAELLDAMTPSNLLRVWLSADAKTDKTSKWFAGPYRLQHVTQWPKALAVEGLALPGRNRFIADDTRVLDVTADVPTLAVDKPGLQIWYRPERQFDSPKAVWRVALRSPAASSAAEQVRSQLLIDWFTDVLASPGQQALQAGMVLRLATLTNGLLVEIAGLRQRQPMLLNEFLDAALSRPISAAQYQRMTARLKERLEWENGKSPMQGVSEALSVAISPANWLPAEKLAALNSMTLQDLEKWRAGWLQQLHIQVLAVGNLAPDDIQRMGELLTERLHPTVTASAIAQFAPRSLAAGLPLLHQSTNSKDHSMLLYLPYPERTLEARANSLLLAQLIRTRYYQSLRTEQQLGYVVNASASWTHGQSSLGFIVQSHDHPSEVLRERTHAYLQEMDARLNSLTERDLAAASKALVANLKTREQNAQTMSNRYWADLQAYDFTFSTREQLSKLIAERTPEQLKAAWKQLRSAPALWVVADPGVASTLADFKRTPSELLAPQTTIKGDEIAKTATSP